MPIASHQSHAHARKRDHFPGRQASPQHRKHESVLIVYLRLYKYNISQTSLTDYQDETSTSLQLFHHAT
jgi:hypothetical protein